MTKKQPKVMEEKVFFVSCIIEEYKQKNKLPGRTVAEMFDKNGITEWLYGNYQTLHTESEESVLADIRELFGI